MASNPLLMLGFTQEFIADNHIKTTEEGLAEIRYPGSSGYRITINERGERSPEDPAEPMFNEGALLMGEPVFMCTSVLDALSIIQAGGTAMAINPGFEKRELKTLKGWSGCEQLIFVTSEECEDRARIILQRLTEKGAQAQAVRMPDQYGSVNDMLRQDPAALAAMVSAAGQEWRANTERSYRSTRSSIAALADFENGAKGRAAQEVVSTGFKRLDKMLGGGVYGLVTLGALSSMGKTDAILQIAEQMAAAGRDVLYFALEMSERELLARIICRKTYRIAGTAGALTQWQVMGRGAYDELTDDQRSRFDTAINELKAYAGRLCIYEGIGDIGVNNVRAAVEEHRAVTGKTPVVIVDYAQILAPADPRASDKTNTDVAVRELKRISRDYSTPVITVSSFNRQNYKYKASMAAFKESGAIEYGSDILLALQPQGLKNDDPYSNEDLTIQTQEKDLRKLEMVLLKNRNGRARGCVQFQYCAPFHCFTEEDGFLDLDSEDWETVG